MVDPVEEFLRRALQQRREQTSDEADPDDEIIDAEVIEDEPPVVELQSPKQMPLIGGIADYGAREIGATDFKDRIARLGVEIDQADDRMEAHMHAVFEHKLGELGATTSLVRDSILDDDSPAKLSASALDFKKLFSTPSDILHAILMNEILQRPEHRW